MEKYGVDTLKKIAESVAQSLNVASKVINKQGIWHLIELKDVIEFWTKVDLKVALAELKECSEVERESVEAAFQSRLDLVNKEVQAKIGALVGLLEKFADIAEDVYAAGEDAYNKALAFIAEVKAVLGL